VFLAWETVTVFMPMAIIAAIDLPHGPPFSDDAPGKQRIWA
jgi:hypothetical protein